MKPLIRPLVLFSVMVTLLVWGSDPLAALQEPGPPRTLRGYWHLFIAFALAWLILCGYLVALGRKLRRLEGEVSRLGVRADHEQAAANSLSGSRATEPRRSGSGVDGSGSPPRS
ncbi:MAG: CcmD family protein [Longimicrobiaceae bacterium]